MEKSCAHILRNTEDDGDMMECLIAHKNDAEQRPDQKCRAAIEHFQLTSLKNYHFTYKFKEACRPYVMRFCPNSNTKNEVVACLRYVIHHVTFLRQSKIVSIRFFLLYYYLQRANAQRHSARPAAQHSQRV